MKNALSIVSGILLLLAIPSFLPYGYFVLLRWVISGTGLYNAYHAYGQKRWWWVCLMLGIATIFNPIFPIHLSKEIWIVIDFVTAMFMWTFPYKESRSVDDNFENVGVQKENRNAISIFWKSFLSALFVFFISLVYFQSAI